ncbi:hypothetical protein CHGG_07462 [Chaetomium globosum CBS 148.51]|uniref:DDE-1 domain-containing protein n=1 Tax=Chaetomium globosum (strain ATCC 6205 / CBS 148.51 / DSM 1962 / NBRC 6347 / NRRL 1970) TaxID=306901 RepID=Q2GX42_CHAGB|nr:uncharacterized protein CHGG_07462 [Chaetomium globosum CBS 148.51]EAQ86209.1 hypothetical protein CHGG_07462 [Chaetomium globosum CBS 148.51]
MANHLLRTRGAPPVGKLWAHRFVKRQPRLSTRRTRRYDYQRAKCEDPKVIGEWFALVQNTRAKYGIVDDDVYNFDETGFMMGMIFPVGLDWIKHFDYHTAPRTKGIYRLLILDGHESHHSTEFELYCRDNKIITLCMPPHSSHKCQPLDVGCFGPLKQAYGRYVEELMRAHINHISKLEFLCAFREAFFASMTEKNIQGGFAGAGIVPFDPERVLSKLDIKLHTPTPPNSRPGTAQPWVSKTPHNPQEASSQSNLIKTHIASHQNSSPASMLAAVDQLTRGTTAVMHQVALLQSEVSSLRKANEALSKRRRAKKTRVQLGGSLTVQDAQDLLD